jgi:hypothetical protein
MKKVLLGLGVLAVAYGIGLIVVASTEVNAEQERRAQEEKIVALGRPLALSFDGMTTYEAVAHACKDKLTPGALRSLVVYTVVSEQGLGGRIVGYSERYVVVGEQDELRRLRTLSDALAHDASPDDWSRYLDDAKSLREETRALRYVAVVQFSDVRQATLAFSGELFDPGRAEYKAKVITFPDGKLVCEGVGQGHMKGEVIGHGKGTYDFQAQQDARENAAKKLKAKWFAAMAASPLHDLCFAGGEQLCFHASVLTEAPDW